MLAKLMSSIFGEGFDMTKMFDSFGPDGAGGGIMDFLGSDLAKNALSGGLAWNQSNQMGDMMDFNKTMATNADNRNQSAFDYDMARTKKHDENVDSIDFGQAK